MDPEENHTTPLGRFAALDRDLPEVFFERQEDSVIRLGEIQESSVARAGEVRSRPSHLVTGSS